MCQNWHTLLSIILALTFLSTLAVAILTWEQDYLFRVQEQSLFLYTPLFFQQCMSMPAGFITWAGCYLTQFFYHPWIGTCLLVALWALLMGISLRTFRIPLAWSVLLIIPVSILAITVFQLGYWIFYLKMQGYFFASTLGTLAVVLSVWGYRLLPGRFFARPLFILLATAVGYPLTGCYALLGALLMGILSWRLNDNTRTQSLTDSTLAVLAVIAIPLICYRTLYHSVNIADIYLVGIPRFQTAETVCLPYYTPYALLALCLLVATLFYSPRRKPTERRPAIMLLVQVLMVVITASATYLNWYKNQNFHLELKMYRAMEQQRWEDILATMQESKSPTRLMAMMKNLALFRLGRQGDDMYQYRPGNRQSAAPIEVRMLQTGGKLLYLNYGQANYCHRWCVEDGVEFGWRIEYLKCMAVSMLMNGEAKAAEKYLHILKDTRYYQSWTGPDQQELAMMKRLMPADNQLTNDNMLVEAFLLNHFANRDSDDPLAQEASLMFALQTCNSEVFLKRLAHYMALKPSQRLPRHCQEALCVYNKADSIPVDDTIRQNYQAFMSTAAQYRGMNIEQVKPLMQERFGNTFFYDYYFNNYQQPQ